MNSVTIDQTAPTTERHADGDRERQRPGRRHPITYQYQWIKNGTDLTGETAATLNLSTAGNGNKGDKISLRVTAVDGTDTSAPVTSAERTIVNAAPAFGQNLPDRSDAEGAVVNLSAGATDPDNDTLTYSATGLPDGVSIDPSTGLISRHDRVRRRRELPGRGDGGRWDALRPPGPRSSWSRPRPQRVAGNGQSITATFDQAPTAGNLIVAVARFAGTERADPSGRLEHRGADPKTSPNGFMMYKVAGASEPAAVSLSLAAPRDRRSP